jgi:molecular chaperone DnaK
MGIDFGTKCSIMAVIDKWKPLVIPNSEGSLITPSVVSLDDKSEIIVGDAAIRRGVLNAQNTVFSIKQLLGKRFDQVDTKVWPTSSFEEDTTGALLISIGQHRYSPEQIAAFILQKLKNDAEKCIGERINVAVITSPVGFCAAQREALVTACKIAGFEAAHIIGESTAACLSSMSKQKSEKQVFIFNQGAGHLNISIIESGEGVYEVKSVIGDTLGGKYIDHRILEWVFDFVKKEQGVNICQDAVTIHRLLQALEIAKIELSLNAQVEINLPYIPIHHNDYVNLSIPMDRDNLNVLCDSFLKQSLLLCEKALELANLSSANIDKILFSGQQARMPVIQTAVQQFLNNAKHSICLIEAAAIGAAIYGGIKSGEIKEVILLDVLPMSVGIALKNDRFCKIIERNTTLPTIKSQVFTFEANSDSNVAIHVLQGEHDLASQNNRLGTFVLAGIPTPINGTKMIDIEVAIEVMENGFLIVTAQELSTMIKQSANFRW